MPKTYLTKQEKLNNELVAYIYGEMKVQKITQQQMADILRIKQPAFSYKLKHGSFSYQDLTEIFGVLQPDGEKLLKIMGVST